MIFSISELVAFACFCFLVAPCLIATGMLLTRVKSLESWRTEHIAISNPLIERFLQLEESHHQALKDIHKILAGLESSQRDLARLLGRTEGKNNA